MFLNHSSTHTLQIHFSIQFPSFLPKCNPLISFKSYTVSCITNLDNSVHPFHPSSSSFFFAHSLPFCIQNAVLHHSSFFFNKEMHRATHLIPSHNFDSLRSASMRLSDKRSLYSSIPHHTAVQPALGTKSYHCSQIPFLFQNLLIGVEQRCLDRNESLFASIPSRK